MAEKKFLHDTQDFLAVLDKVSQRMKIAPQFVEKDYWLMHGLWALHHLGLYYELKGGTSLSKGWDLISRFSEDVDIKIISPEGMSVASRMFLDMHRFDTMICNLRNYPAELH